MNAYKLTGLLQHHLKETRGSVEWVSDTCIIYTALNGQSFSVVVTKQDAGPFQRAENMVQAYKTMISESNLNADCNCGCNELFWNCPNRDKRGDSDK